MKRIEKLPGAKAARMVYDPADRLVGECSAHHPDTQWRLFGYDFAGRLVVKADFTMTDAQAAAYASECRVSALETGGAYGGYTMPGAPSGGKTVSASYYDTYDFITVNALPSSFNWSGSGFTFSYANPGKVSVGLLTGVYTGKGYEAYYYNLDGQLMETNATGFNEGKTNYTYTYSGAPAKRWWTLPDGTVRTLEWSYDASGRPTGMTVSYLGNGGEAFSHTLTYNKAGLVSDEKWGNGGRGLEYDVAGRIVNIMAEAKTPKPPRPGGTAAMAAAVGPPQYMDYETLTYDAAGRIASKTHSGGTYSYSYDSRGRLVKAATSGTKDFTETYTYDDRCNITSLVRKGIVDKSGTTEVYGTLDDMTFVYNGNKLTSLENDTEAVAFEGMTGLGKSGTFSKSYDVSGRLTYDSSRGITNITYNNDGLPLKVSFRDMSQQEYEWDGLGNHVATRFYGVSYTGKQYTKMTRKYTGDGRVIDNNAEVYAQYPGGYMQDSTYYWYVKDYQGNNIAVMDGSKNFIQQTDYYPYGEPWREPAGQPWLYSGNERLRLDGINEYDFNARRFNSVEGRFSSWDTMNEKYPWLSPYAYCGGDPVNAVDKDGELIIFINGMHFGDGGTQKYWNGVNLICQDKFKDYNTRYYDGSVGGLYNIFYNRYPYYRYKKGRETALRDAKVIFSEMEEGESIKIITHSMGAAYGKGFIQGLKEYAEQQDLDIDLEVEIDIAPYNSLQQRGHNGVKTLTLSHGDDIIAGPSHMDHATNITKRPLGILLNMLGVAGLARGYFSHSITSFSHDILELDLQVNPLTGGSFHIWEERYNSH